MEIVTKKYFVSFLDCFYKLCNLKDIDTLGIIEEDIQILVKKMKKFDLLEVDHFHTSISVPNESSKFQQKKSGLIFKLYWIIVENLFGIPGISDNNYEEYLWSALLSLDYEEYIILQDISVPFRDKNASGLNLYYLSLNKNSFEYSKTKFKKICELKVKDDDIIDSHLFEKIERDFTQAINFYNKYVESNYSSIQNHFSYYKNCIRVYPIRKLSAKGERLMFKIMVYDTQELPPITIYNKYSTFATKPGNIEEFNYQVKDDVLLISDFKKENFFDTLFSVQSIHYELIRNFTKLATEHLLFDFIDYLLTIDNNIIVHKNKKDFSIKILQNTNHTVSYLFHFSKKISVDEFESIDEDVKHVFLVKPDDKIVNKIGISNVIYLNYFTKHYLNQAIHYFVKDNIKHLKMQDDFGFKYKLLIDRLEKCNPGREDWNKFENIGIEIFDFLFKDDFRHFSFEKQSKTIDGIFRRDYLVNNLPKKSESFWNDIKSSYSVSINIVEFKNYVSPLNSSTLYDTTKYLSSNNGNFILVFTRVGLDESAKELQIKMLRDRSILIIVLNDKDLTEMIYEKALNIDVTYRLESKKFDLIKSL